MNLLLIGYRGSGKSAVGRLLAERLSLAFFDADEELERRAGRSIAQMFAEQGEPYFRDLESQTLKDLAAQRGAVLSLGGGVVLRPENREVIRAAGTVVWLRASAATLHRRIEEDAATAARRPNLTAAGGLAEIEQLLAARTPLYEACADLPLDTDALSTAEVAEAILAKLPSLGFSA